MILCWYKELGWEAVIGIFFERYSKMVYVTRTRSDHAARWKILCDRNHTELGNRKHDESLSVIAWGRGFNILSLQYRIPPKMCACRKYSMRTIRVDTTIYIIYTFITLNCIIEKAAANVLFILILTLRMRYNKLCARIPL